MQKVVSLQTAKKLAEAGIVLETEKYWCPSYSINKVKLSDKYYLIDQKTAKHSLVKEYKYDFIPAPDIAELLGELPIGFGIYKNEQGYVCCGTKKMLPIAIDLRDMCIGHDEPVEALAQLLLWVKTQEGVK